MIWLAVIHSTFKMSFLFDIKDEMVWGILWVGEAQSNKLQSEQSV